MAEKITDQQLRKELIQFGEKNVGAVTDSTRPIYLKKLNHLRARQNQALKAGKSKSTNRKLLGFSSDESDDEKVPAPVSRSRRVAPATTRRGRSSAATGPAPNASDLDKSAVQPSTSLTRPALRNRSRNARTPTPAAASSTSKNWRTASRTDRSCLDDSTIDSFDTRSPVSSSKFSDSIGLQTSLAHESQESEEDFDFDVPDALANSDSDLDVSKVPDFSNGSEIPPDYVNKSINTSFPLDSTFASQNSDYGGGNEPRCSSGVFGSFYRQSPPTAKQRTPLSKRSANVGKQSNKKSGLLSKTQTSRPYAAGTFKSEEKNSWKASLAHHVSMFLVILFVLFFVAIGITYWNMQSSSGHNTIPAAIASGVCDKGNGHDCVTKENYEKAMEVIEQLGPVLDDRAAQAECGYGDRIKKMSIEDAKDAVTMDYPIRAKFKPMVMKLIELNTQWQIRLLDADGVETDHLTATHLESTFLSLPLWCRVSRALSRVVNFILTLVLVALCVSLGLALLRWHWRRQREETRNVYDIVERIIDILKSHSDACQDNPDLQPYMPIVHVRDVLIPPKERRKKQALWDKAVKFLSANESRVRVEIKTIDGEDFTVWKWLQACPNGRKVWQGQAFGESKDGTGMNSPRYSPSPCLKIRNMFDLEVEFGNDWHVHIQDALLEKCGPEHKILHIAVDTTSREGCVYVKCADEKASGQAYKALHGWWFDGNLVTVKYLRLERYHERFPDAVQARSYMQPSNAERKSLSQPFHHSVMEAS